RPRLEYAGRAHMVFARQLNAYAPIGLQVAHPVRPAASTGKQIELAVECREPDLNAVRPPTSTAGCGQVQEQVARGAREPVSFVWLHSHPFSRKLAVPDPRSLGAGRRRRPARPPTSAGQPLGRPSWLA